MIFKQEYFKKTITWWILMEIRCTKRVQYTDETLDRRTQTGLLDTPSLNTGKRTNIRVVSKILSTCSAVCKTFAFDCTTKVNAEPLTPFTPLATAITGQQRWVNCIHRTRVQTHHVRNESMWYCLYNYRGQYCASVYLNGLFLRRFQKEHTKR